jgi:hypothetical protein
MVSKDDVLETLLLECDICTHLFEKLPEGALDYRPTLTQRSTLELLRYLSFSGIGFVAAVVHGDWDVYSKGAEGSSSLAAEDFPEAMRRQKDALREAFAGLTEEHLETGRCTMPWGTEMSVGRGLLMLPLRSMAAYRMQLFLYAKSAGNEEIWTPDCWAGVSMEKPAPQADDA